MALLDQNAGIVGALLGIGNGTFQPIIAYGTGYSPEALFTTDFDWDGNLDLVIAMGDAVALTPNPNSQTITVLFGKGDGTFYAAPFIPMAGTPQGMAVGDLNGDNRPDIVTANNFNGSLSVLLSQGGDRFQTQAPIPFPSSTGNAGPSSVAIADLNGDRRSDLIVGDSFTRRVWTLAGNGNGTFQSAVSYPAPGQVKGVVAADFNGDGRPDVVAATDAGVAVYLGNAGGTLGSATTLAAASKPTALAAVDLNGDSRLDLVVVSNGTFGSATDTGGLTVLLGNGNGTFQPAVNYAAGANPSNLTLADFNGDGRPDLAVSTNGPNFGNFVALLLGDAGGRFRAATLITTDFGPAGLTAVDLNGDGKLDLAISHCCGDTDMTFMQGNGDGTFQKEVHIGTLSPSIVQAVDLNADGKPDLIVAQGDAGSSGGVSILLNTSPAAATFANVSGASFQPGAVAPESIVAAFGARLANATAQAAVTPLPTSLGGTSVSVRDSAGTSRVAPLIFVSPAQVNYVVPAGTATGAAAVTITSADGATGTVSQNVERVAPGIFTQAGGLAAASILRVAADGTQSTEAVTGDPIDLGPEADQVILLLFGTGFRFQSSATVKMGGEDVEVLFAGAQGSFAGLDQANVRVPRSLIGRGLVDVALTTDGKAANVVRINVK